MPPWSPTETRRREPLDAGPRLVESSDPRRYFSPFLVAVTASGMSSSSLPAFSFHELFSTAVVIRACARPTRLK